MDGPPQVFKAGDRVRVTWRDDEAIGLVHLASANGCSLAVTFDDPLILAGGGGFGLVPTDEGVKQIMPLLYQDGQWKDVFTDRVLGVEDATVARKRKASEHIKDIRPGDYVRYRDDDDEVQTARIACVWGVGEDGRLAPPSKGGFGVVTDSGLRVGMMQALSYHKRKDIE